MEYHGLGHHHGHHGQSHHLAEWCCDHIPQRCSSSSLPSHSGEPDFKNCLFVWAERGAGGGARSPAQWSGEKYLKRSDQNSQQPTTIQQQSTEDLIRIVNNQRPKHPPSQQQLSSLSRADTSAKTISLHLGKGILQTSQLLWVYDVCCVLDQNKSRLSVSRLILNSVVVSNWQVIPN